MKAGRRNRKVSDARGESRNSGKDAEARDGGQRKPGRRRTWIYVVVGVVVAALVGWLIYSGLLTQAVRFERSLDTESMREAIQNIGPAAPLASIGLMILHTYVPFPLEILALANGLVFGTWGGIAITWFSMVLSSWVGYATTRFGRPLAYRITSGERLEKMEAWTARRSTWQLVAIRFVPVVSFSLLNLAMGLLKVPFWKFTWTTALGIIPIVVVSVVAGNLLHLGPVAWAVIGVIIAVYLGWEILRRTMRRSRADDNG